jgi:DNA-binding transcriptional regulator YhcF (GntR family)
MERIDSNSKMPKYRQVVNSIMTDIKQDLFKPGQKIPSINETSAIYYLSRDTVEKAYQELKLRGIIYSIPGKGCFVTPDAHIGKGVIKILVLLNKFEDGEMKIYKALSENFGEDFIMNLSVYNDNVSVFSDIVLDNLTEYNYFVIVPPEDPSQVETVLKKIPKNKMVILGKCPQYLEPEVMNIETGIGQHCFHSLLPLVKPLKKYKKLVFVCPRKSQCGKNLQPALERLCKQYHIPFSMVKQLDRKLEKDTAYLLMDDRDLPEFMKLVSFHKLLLGKNVGLLSWNDAPFKTCLNGGISVVTYLYEEIGNAVADYILIGKKDCTPEMNKLCFIERKSL